MKASFGFKSALRVGMVAVAGFVALGAVSQAQALSLSVTGNKYQSAPISFSNSQSTGVYNQSMGGIQVNDGSNTFWVCFTRFCRPVFVIILIIDKRN